MSGRIRGSLSGLFLFCTLLPSANAVTRLGETKYTLMDQAKAEDAQNAPETYHEPQYSVKIAVGKPTFSSDLKYYEEFYGSTKPFFSLFLSRDYYRTDSLSLGWGAQFGYYKADGSQMQTPKVSEPDTLEKADGKTSLTLIPYQLLLTASYRPMGKHSWLSIDTWLGYEELYFQEVRNEGSTTSSSSIGDTSSKKKDTTSQKRAINSGWHSGVVIGASFNFLLNSLDEKNTRSLKRGVGFGGIYMSPFFETVLDMGSRVYIAGKESSKVTFARQTFGLAFTFTTST